MKDIIHTDMAPAAVGPYNQAVKVNNMIFTAGQLGIDPVTGQFAGATNDTANDVVAQTEQALRNIKAVLKAAGSGMRDIVKTTIFALDLSHFQDVNRTYADFLAAEGVAASPARSTVEVAGLPLGGLVEIEAIAVVEA